jgi:outer membrane protein TolC
LQERANHDAANIEYPDVVAPPLDEVTKTESPLTLANATSREIWDLKLEDAVQYTLNNSKVMRTLGAQAFIPNTLAGGSRFGDPVRLNSAPATVQSTFAPSIVESNPQSGVEAALSAFDAQLSNNIFWTKTDRPQNSTVAVNGVSFQPAIFQDDAAQNVTQLSKRIATGGAAIVRNYTYYDLNNSGTLQFHNAWQPTVEAEFDHPLLQGAGVQFNRIAGPGSLQSTLNAQQPASYTASPGVYNGVAIARINHDISLADFEIGVRNIVQEVELAYWRLYYNYRDLDAQVAGRDSALATWRKIYALYREGARGGEAEKEAQARAQYFLFRGQVEGSLSDLFTTENQLRFLMGLAPTDGRLIRPADEPTTARVQFDWAEINVEALGRNPELRQQKWRIKQHELQLIAAKNFLMPQLNTQALYRWRGFGNSLISSQQNVFNRQGNLTPFGSAWGNLLEGGYNEWQLGVTFAMPLGFRQAMAAVRNEQLQLSRERAILQDQELEVAHQLSNAVRSLDRFYTLCQTNFNRRVATERQVTAVRAAYDTGTVTLDLLLDAQRQLAASESAYYDSLALYNQSISQVHFRKGSLLEYNGVFLAEGPWADKAYFDARKRAKERDAGMYINYGFTRPNVFSRGPINQQTGANHGEPSTSEPAPAEGQPTPAAESVPTPPAEKAARSVQPAATQVATALPASQDSGASVIAWARAAGHRTPDFPKLRSRSNTDPHHEVVADRPVDRNHRLVAGRSRSDCRLAGGRVSS